MIDQNTPVTVLGTGSMGSALAAAFLAARHPTTVWNRSPQRAAPLVAAGANQQLAIADAIAASPLIIACLTTFQATRDSLTAVEAGLKGRTLITLNSGTPSEAREFARWVTYHGAAFPRRGDQERAFGRG